MQSVRTCEGIEAGEVDGAIYRNIIKLFSVC